MKLQVLGLATLWVLFLVASTSVGSSSSALWLLAVGAVGMLQNILVAAWPRESGVYGVHLEFKHCFMEQRVFETLVEVERTHPKIGRSSVGLFFPNGITKKQEKQLRTIEDQRGDPAAGSQGQREPVLDAATGHSTGDMELESLLPQGQASDV